MNNLTPSYIGLLAVLLALPLQLQARERFNPFAPPPEVANPDPRAVGGGSGTALELKAVMLSADNPLANVSGELLGIGEKVLGYTLVAVSKQGVQLERGGEALFLPLHPVAPEETAGGQDG